jgi:NADPH:quinone reductase-like Zn-dependent oxidoreductase
MSTVLSTTSRFDNPEEHDMSTTPAAIAATSAATIAAAQTGAHADTPTTEPMRAAVQHRYGGPDTVSVGEWPRPTIEPDEVLVRVAAAGVDRGVWHLMTGLPYVVRLAGYGIRRPKQPVPGLDVAGTVVDVGADVEGFDEGDEVYGVATGAYAEFARAKATKLAHRPADVSVEQAATIAISGATASQALFEVGRAESGQRVLILGASGGVGSWATMLAHTHGLHVTGVASAAKASFVRDLGADVALDYASDDFTEAEPFDLIIDIGGRNRISKLRRALTRTGTLVIVGGEGGGRVTGGAGRQLRALLLSPFVRQRLTTFIAKEDAEQWTRVHELVAAGAIDVPVDRAYPLDRAAEALADLAAGRIAGKAVITVDHD